MSQKVCNLFERSAALDQAARNRMTQDVGAANAVFETAARGGISDGIANDVEVGWRIMGRTVPYKDLAARGQWTPALQVIGDRVSGKRGQREDIDALALGMDVQRSRSPVHIVELQLCNLGSLQAQIEQTAGDRIVY